MTTTTTSSPTTTSADAYLPVRVTEVDVAEALPTVALYDDERTYGSAWVLVRLQSEPLGAITLQSETGTISPDVLAATIEAKLGERLTAVLAREGTDAARPLTAAGLPDLPDLSVRTERAALLEDAPLISVVLCTRDRPDDVQVGVEGLLALDYPNYEIIVVDNAPQTDATQRFVEETYGHVAHLRYVQEPRPGLSWARNCGYQVARGDYIAFTDDDAVADKYWLSELLRGFRAGENVGCVTGQSLPSEIETVAQWWFQQEGDEGGFGKGFDPMLYDLDQNRADDLLYPYRASMFGSGLNMAFTRDALRAIGGFAVALGAGSRARSGEDLAAYLDVLLAGYQLAYQPGAMVSHAHRRTVEGLYKQMHGYAVGYSAYLTRLILQRPEHLLKLLGKIPAGLRFFASPDSAKNVKKHEDYPTDIAQHEARGYLQGPWAYVRSAMAVRRMIS